MLHFLRHRVPALARLGAPSTLHLCAQRLLLGMATAWALSAHAAGDQASQADSKPALTVSVASPELVRLDQRLVANGNIAAWQEAVIASEVDGLRLLDVQVNVGDAVKRGQLLARYATDSVQTEVQQAQANVDAAQANLANAQANDERARQLLEQGFISPQGRGLQRTLEQTAQAELARAQAALAAQRLRLKQTEVRASDAGVISARQATVGAVHNRGAELFRMIRQGRLEWRAEVTAAELARVRVGAPVQLQLPSGERIQGRVRMLAPTVDLQSRNALVYVDLPPMGRSSARAGSFAQGELVLGSREVLTVAQSAVLRRDGFAYVFRLDGANKVQRVKVQTGQLEGARIEITQGLKRSDQVVLSGAGFLNDGDVVRVVASANKP